MNIVWLYFKYVYDTRQIEDAWVTLLRGCLFSHLSPHLPSKNRFNSLEDAGSKHSGEVEGRHAVFFVVAIHEGEEVAEVPQQAEVNIWKLLEQVSHIWPRYIIAALCRHTIRYQKRLKVEAFFFLFLNPLFSLFGKRGETSGFHVGSTLHLFSQVTRSVITLEEESVKHEYF